LEIVDEDCDYPEHVMILKWLMRLRLETARDELETVDTCGDSKQHVMMLKRLMPAAIRNSRSCSRNG
jgi:hypothetical protein